MLRCTVMRAYKFLNANWGLDSLRKQRLKQSCVDDLNDPFELLPWDLTNPNFREVVLTSKRGMGEKGVLCFSMDWSDPVIWAHYADKHKGLCLGFEIPEPNDDNILKVEYKPKPEPFPLDEYLACSEKDGEQYTRKALQTKFDNWKYEKEIRVWGQLGEQEGALYFVHFNENLRLVEVIRGVGCETSETEILDTLGPLVGQATIRKARRAYNRYEMVEDQDAVGQRL
jgi:hypothetical protein